MLLLDFLIKQPVDKPSTPVKKSFVESIKKTVRKEQHQDKVRDGYEAIVNKCEP